MIQIQKFVTTQKLVNCDPKRNYCGLFFFFLPDNPNRDFPREKEARSERQKWLTDLCVEYLEKYIFNTDEVTVLVE